MPYPNEHSCRLKEPNYDEYRRGNCDQKHNGKCIDVIYGIRNGKSETQALRYKTSIWNESDARAHCDSRGGSFHPASKEKAMNEHILKAITTESWLITEEMLNTIISIANRTQPEAIEFKEAESKTEKHCVKVRGNVGIIDIKGPIFRYANLFTKISGATSVADVSKQFQEVLDDPSIKTIILNIDSPGGQANGINELAEAIFAARQQKKIVAYVGGSGTSAAYWIASAAGEIIVDDTAILGSIGVVLSVRRKNNSELEFVSSRSPEKRLNPETEEGRKKIIEFLDSLADVFIEKVARNRNTSVDTVRDKFGQGGLVVGAKAVALGMADKLGSFETIIGGSTMPLTKDELVAKYPEIANALKAEGREEVAGDTAKLIKSAEALAEENKKLKRANLLQTLTTRVGAEHANKLISLAEKLEASEVDAIAGIIEIQQKVINDLGEKKGSGGGSDVLITEAQAKLEVKKIAHETGLSESDAWIEWAKANPLKAAALEGSTADE